MAALDEAGTPRYLVTAIARDGTLDGPDLRLYKQVLALTDRPVIASGGVRTADDIWALRDAGCEAVGHRQGAVREDAQALPGDPGVAACWPSGSSPAWTSTPAAW